MSGHQGFLQRGMEMAKKATEKDKTASQDKDTKVEVYEEIVRDYDHAIQQFMAAIKYDKNPKSQEAIRTKVVEYLKRAEDIKKHIEEMKAAAKAPQKPQAEGGGSGTGNGDNSELRDALMSNVVMDSPNVGWDDVCGLHAAKEALNEAVILPIQAPQFFTGKRKPWRGILLFGPPGTGKSYLAKAVATEANQSTFISVSASSLVSKWQGQSERLVSELFALAREKSPSIIFLDECDSLCGARGEGQSESSGRIKTEFLVQMQGVGSDNTGLLVLGATNIPWQLDSAIRRRFEKRIYIPLPEVEDLAFMYKLHLGKTPSRLTEQDLSELGMRSHGRSGADIHTLVHDAIYQPVRKIQHATHFKQVQVRLVDKTEEFAGTVQLFSRSGVFDVQWEATADREWKDGTYWTPCSPGDPDAVENNWMKLPAAELLEPLVDREDMEKALHKSKPTVNASDLEQLTDWSREFGEEG